MITEYSSACQQLEYCQGHDYNNRMANGEMVNVFNEAGEIVATLTRKENVLVFIFDSSGQVWVQLRSSIKKYYSGR